MKKRFALYGMFAAMAIFAAACGDDSSSSASAPEDEEYSSAIDDEESSSSEEDVSSSSAKKDGKSSSSEAKKGKSSSSDEDDDDSSSSEAKKDDKSSSSEKAKSSSSAKDDGKSSSSEAKKDDKSSSSKKADSSNSSEPESSSSSLPYGLTCSAKRDGNVVSAEAFIKTLDGTVEISKVEYDYENMKVWQSLPFSMMDIASCEAVKGVEGVLECSDETKIAEIEYDLEPDDLYPTIATPADAEKNLCSEFESGFDVNAEFLNKDMLDGGKYGEFRDLRDAKLYRTIKVGNQTWMAQNLNYATSSGSSCYGGESYNCHEYGRLYTWETAQTVCPDGWRLPTKADFVKLIANVDSDFDETSSSFSNGEKLRTESWYEGSNEIGFSAVAGGDYYSEKYSYKGSDAYFWSQTANGESEAYVMMVSTSGEGNNLFGGSTGTTMNSVRCIKK